MNPPAVNFSIIICSYNPDPLILSRLLVAIKSFSINPAQSEVIIIDNNSSSPLSTNKDVQSFLSFVPSSSLVVEKKPGLTSARLAGYNRAKNEWLIFFDDDNEPSCNYLINLEKLITANPQVGCWGPGIIKVEYSGNKIHPWFYNNKYLFQEKQISKDQVDRKPQWLECYPFGTGLAIKKDIVCAYQQNIASGKFTLTDRIGKKLVSGGDTQLVLQGVKLGYYAGTSPLLSMKHLIAKKKLKFKYMLRQVYMTATCYVRAYNEIGFENNSIKIETLDNQQIIRTAYALFKINIGRVPFRNVLLMFYERMGEINARFFASHSIKKPVVLKIFEQCINV